MVECLPTICKPLIQKLALGRKEGRKERRKGVRNKEREGGREGEGREGKS